jgi:hypothetical protein
MPGRVTDYESKYDHEVAPKTLHGVQEVKMLVIQCADQRSRTQVLLGIEVEPGDVRLLPENTWENLGRPSPWLKEQLDEALGVKPPEPTRKPAPKKKARKKSGSVPIDNAV